MIAPAEPSASLLRLSAYGVELGRGGTRIQPVRDVELVVRRGEAVGVIGESGSGKTLTALSLLGLLPRTARPRVSGESEFDGAPLPSVGSRRWRQLRGTEIAMVFQDPLSALNPSISVGNQIAELYRRRAGLGRSESRTQTLAAMARVRIPDPERRFALYPHEYSGGMRQRAMIAMAIALSPKLLVADEPTTALDVTVQAEILALLDDLRRDQGMAVILVTHDLAVARRFANSIMVMYAGRTVESGPAGDVIGAPQHPYTRALRGAIPSRTGREVVRPITGSPPDALHIPSGCAFHPRCSRAESLCAQALPETRELDGSLVACHFAGTASAA